MKKAGGCSDRAVRLAPFKTRYYDRYGKIVKLAYTNPKMEPSETKLRAVWL